MAHVSVIADSPMRQSFIAPISWLGVSGYEFQVAESMCNVKLETRNLKLPREMGFTKNVVLDDFATNRHKSCGLGVCPSNPS